ncbi:MAG: HEAT repeat domain-containing protein [Bradymonadaceae bacterium]
MSKLLLRRISSLGAALSLSLVLLPACERGDSPPVTVAGADQVPQKAAALAMEEEESGEEAEAEPDPLGPGTAAQQVKLNQAKTAFLTDDYDAAEKLFLELIAMEPISSATVSGAIALGQIYVETNRRAEALALYEGFATRAGDIPELILVLARTYASLGEPDRALKAYEKTIELEPDFVFVLPEIGTLHAQAGRTEEAGAAYYRYEQRVYELAKKLENHATADEERLHIVEMFSFLHDDRATEGLIKALKDPHPRIRLTTAIALGELNVTAARTALETTIVEDGDPQVRMAAREALQSLRDEPSGEVDPIRPTRVESPEDLPQ